MVRQSTTSWRTSQNSRPSGSFRPVLPLTTPRNSRNSSSLGSLGVPPRSIRSSRGWDLAYAAHGFVQFLPDGNRSTDAPRLRALVDGYGLSMADRQALPAQLAAHTQGMHDLLLRGHQTGEQPWSRLYTEGHANHWGPTATYLAKHQNTWLTALL